MHIQTVIMPSFIILISPDKFNGGVYKSRITWFWTHEDAHRAKRKNGDRYTSYDPHDIGSVNKLHACNEESLFHASHFCSYCRIGCD